MSNDDDDDDDDDDNNNNNKYVIVHSNHRISVKLCTLGQGFPKYAPRIPWNPPWKSESCKVYNKYNTAYRQCHQTIIWLY
jgi:leucyl-tRNA synthetase